MQPEASEGDADDAGAGSQEDEAGGEIAAALEMEQQMGGAEVDDEVESADEVRQ
jgi:hypothetical protein